MAYYDITTFDGTTIVSTNRQMVDMGETGGVLLRMGLLENGAKYDADGTANADTILGTVTARYRIVPSSNGLTSLNSHVRTLEGLRGKEGTLTGIERAASDATYTCTARCADVIAEEISVSNGDRIGSAARTTAFVTVIWEKKTEWAAS